MPSLRDALEAALVEDPDDLATHRAYADYLQEQGDPRGEFIQVQLALEDPARTTEERRELERRERELLAEHEQEWLGTLAEELLSPEETRGETGIKPYEFRFARGWLDRIVRNFTPERTPNLGQLLSQAPESRLLRELVLGFDEGAVKKLLGSPFLSNLRLLHLDVRMDWIDSEEPSIFLGRCRHLSYLASELPRLEQLLLFGNLSNPDRLFALPNLRNLRVLKVEYSLAFLPLEVLADNPALGNLTHLLLHPPPSRELSIDLTGIRALIQSPHLRSLTHLQLRRSDLGDVGCTEIVTSGVLKRLKELDLRGGEITDVGARILADCPDLQHLELLDIDRNGLTQAGINALRRVLGDKLRADNQQTAEELAQRQYLHEGDWE